nr:hypothetical protein CFP56_76387 [Quercus suber]
MWRPSGVTLVHPTIKRKPPSRPKKKRAREPNEPTSRRAGIFKQCKACGKLGHNRRSYKGEIGRNSSLPSTTNRTSTSNKASMHSFKPGAPSQAKTSSATQFAPSQTRMHQSSPNVTTYVRTSSSNPYTQQHSSTPAAPHQLGSTTQNLGAH